MRRGNRNGEEGVALLLVLLFVTLLSAIIVDYCYEMRVDAALAGNRTANLEAYLGAKSAVALGMSLLESDLIGVSGAPGATYDALTDVWAAGIPFQEIDRAVVRCAIADEYGKINLNALIRRRDNQPNEVLQEALRMLFVARGLEEDPVDAILDWIDTDDEVRPNGAEADYYADLDLPYGCKNGPMDSVEELLLIRGVTLEVFFGNTELGQAPLTELLTVHGHRGGRVNVNTAHRETLLAFEEALGRPGLADLIIQARDQSPFETRADLQVRGITAGQGQESSVFDVSSRVFRIHGDGLSRDSKVRLEVFVRRESLGSTGGYRFLDWRVLG